MIQLILLGIALTAVIGFGTGWVVSGWKHDAAEKAETVELLNKIKDQDDKNRALTKKYQEAQGQTKVVYRTIEKKVKDETSNRVCLNAGAVSVWNSALWGSLPTTAPGASEAPGGTDTATDREVLTNAVENMAQYKECRDQLNTLIDWHESQNPES